MANDLSTIMGKILARALLTLRESAYMPRLVNSSYDTEAAEYGDTIDVPIPAAVTVTDVTPSNVYPVPSDVTPTKVQIVLDQWKKANFHLTDKQMNEVDRNNKFLPMEMAEAVRGLANVINAAIFSKYKGIYGFVGTAGTTPFATTVLAATDARKVLNQQLAPRDMRRGVLDFSAEANALALPQFSDAEKVGSSEVKIKGEIGEKYGIDWVADDAVPTHTTNATGSGALTVNGVNAVGSKVPSIAKAAGANWSALVGDIVSFAGDAQTYVVTANTTVVQGANTVLPINPGLKIATAGGEAVTVRATHVVNLAFHRDAFAFAQRPMVTRTADLSLGNQMVSMTDPQTGISLRLEVIREHKQVVWELDALYGAALVRPELAVRIAG